MAKWAEPTRFYLDCDNDSHIYIIPVTRREDFEAWVESEAEDVPDYAQKVDISPNFVTFTDPKIET